MVLISAKMKKFFFDRKLVKDLVDKDTLRFLRNAGGFGRKVARNSMKRKGKARKRPKSESGAAFAKWQREIMFQPASPPGTPPFAHSDDENRSLKKILFALDTSNGNNYGVLVGPVGLKTARQVLSNEIGVPELMERGGKKRIVEKRVGGKWMPLNGRARPGQPTRTRMANYPARPYMGPAKEATQKKFPQLWFSSSGVG